MQYPEPLPEDTLSNSTALDPAYDYGGGLAPPIYGYGGDGSEIGIIKELSPKKVLEQVRMNLKGFYWDAEKKEYIKIPGMEPLMNDVGISKYLSILSSVITDLVTFSNYKHQEINKLTMYVCEKALPTIHINYKEYGIKQKSDLQIIDVQIFNLTLAAFKKAVGAGDRNVVRGTFGETLSPVGHAPQASGKRGFLSTLFGPRGGGRY